MHNIARKENLKGQNHLRGATTVELALVVPIIILLLLGAIEFSRYSTARGIAESAAQQAASLASYVPNLDSEGGILTLDQTTYVPDGSSINQCSGDAGDDPCVLQQDALKKVIDKLTRISASAGLTLQSEGTRITRYAVKLPSDPTLTLVDTLSKKPIEVMLQGEFVPLVPGLGKIPFTVKALTFREIRKGSSMPVDPPSCGTNCRCPNRGPEWRLDPSNPNQCICVAGMHRDQDGNCVCDTNGQVFIQSTRSCGCTNTCFANQYLAADCTCTACPNGTTLSNGQCLCPGGGVANLSNSAYPCGCGANQYMCTAKANPLIDQCVSRTCPNPATMEFSESACKCVCKSGNTTVGKPKYVQCAGEDFCRDVQSCNGAVSNQTFDPVSCRCTCGNAAKPQQCGENNSRCMAPCRDGATTDLLNCACKCPTPKIYELQTQRCICPSGYKSCYGKNNSSTGPVDNVDTVNGGFVFDLGTDEAMAGWSALMAANNGIGSDPNSADMGVGGGRDLICVRCEGGSLDSSCGCICPAGKTLCNGACISCTGGTVNPVNCQCTCPAGASRCNNGNTCISCQAPKISDLTSCSCECPECSIDGAVPDPTTCGCSCPPDRYECGGRCVLSSRPTNCQANFGTWDPVNCVCQCGPNSSPAQGGGCACNTGYIRCNGNCVANPSGAQPDPNNSCNFICPAGTQLCNGACVSTTCSIPGQAFVCSATGPACVCDLQCGAGKGNYFNPATQQCECICTNPNQELINGSCVDKCTDGKVRDGSGSCVCPSGTGKGTCTNGNCLDCSTGPKTVFNLSTCSCQCPAVTCGVGKSQNPFSCDCECELDCPAPIVFSGSPMGQNPTTCSCNCPSGMDTCQNGCHPPCAQGQSRNQTTCECVCPTCVPPMIAETATNGSCGCRCPTGLFPYNGACVPPNCATGYCPGTPPSGGYGG